MVTLALALLACSGDTTTTADSGTTDSGTVTGDSTSLENPERGEPALQSVQNLAFAADGTLAIGDGSGDQIVAVDLPAGQVTTYRPDIDDIYVLVAQAFGDSNGPDANIWDIAAHPTTGRIYIAAERLSTGEAALFQVDDDDTVSLVDLSDVYYSVAPYASGGSPGSLVMGMQWTSGHIVAAVTEANWTTNQVHTVSVPVAHGEDAVVTSTNTYHRSHRQWETMAPVVSLAAYRDGGQDYVAATYTCTPTVRFTEEALSAGESETLGETPFDYGGGKQVMDMVVNGEGVYATIDGMFRSGQSGWDAFGAVRVDRSLLVQSDTLNEDADTVITGGETMSHAAASRVEALDGAYRLSVVDDTHIVALQHAGLRVIEVSAP